MTEKKTKKKTAAKKPAAKKKVAKKASGKSIPKEVVDNAPIVGKRPTNKKLDPKPKPAKKTPISYCDPASLVVTVLGVGHIPLAPGTWGSLIAVAIYQWFLILPVYAASTINDMRVVALVAVAILVLLYSIGVVAIKSYQEQTGTKDAGEIVYDEFFGQILTYSLVIAFYIGLAHQLGAEIESEITGQKMLMIQFVPFFMFRLFDIAKPWPIWVIDKKDNRPSGVMLDDVVAAIYAATASVLAFFALESLIPGL